jgi:uncharacterized protein YuzE
MKSERNLMDKNKIKPELIKELMNLKKDHIWFDFDMEADVIYISFVKPQNAKDSILENDGTIRHYRGDHLTGVTITNATKFLV